MYSLLETFYFSIFKILESIILPYFWVALFVVFIQYNKIGKMERNILGINRRSPLVNTFQAAFFGLFGGIVGSIIFLHLKVVIYQRDFLYILPMALILSIIHPRFICFSYSGSIISLLSLLTGWPNINVVGIMFVVGVLHLVESMLILLDGTRTKVPVFIEKKGEVVGGFTINSFWPVPFIIFVNKGIIYPVTLFAILGYGDFTLSNFPKKKSRESASLLFTFSIILISLSKLSMDYSVFKYLSAIFAPLAHEIIIFLGKYKEEKNTDTFNYSIGGLRILDVLPNSIGKAAGFQQGDVILSINGKKLFHKKDLEEILYYRPRIISAKVFNFKEGIVIREYLSEDKRIDNLGLIVMPNEPEYMAVGEETETAILKFINKFRRRKLKFKN